MCGKKSFFESLHVQVYEYVQYIHANIQETCLCNLFYHLVSVYACMYVHTYSYIQVHVWVELWISLSLTSLANKNFSRRLNGAIDGFDGHLESSCFSCRVLSHGNVAEATTSWYITARLVNGLSTYSESLSM